MDRNFRRELISFCLCKPGFTNVSVQAACSSTSELDAPAATTTTTATTITILQCSSTASCCSSCEKSQMDAK